MALTRTLLQLRTEAKQRADMENSSFVADAEWTRWINSGYAELYDMLVRARGLEYFGTTGTVNTVAGTETVALPSTFYKVWGVSAQVNGDWIPMKRLAVQERDDYDFSGSWSARINVPRYLPMAGNLLLRPVPDGVYTIKFWYVPHITALSADGDTLDGVNGWEEYVVLYAAIRGLVKEESDTSALRADLMDIRARIEAMAERDEGTPMTVADVRPRRRYTVDL